MYTDLMVALQLDLMRSVDRPIEGIEAVPQKASGKHITLLKMSEKAGSSHNDCKKFISSF